MLEKKAVDKKGIKKAPAGCRGFLIFT